MSQPPWLPTPSRTSTTRRTQRCASTRPRRNWLSAPLARAMFVQRDCAGVGPPGIDIGTRRLDAATLARNRRRRRHPRRVQDGHRSTCGSTRPVDHAYRAAASRRLVEDEGCTRQRTRTEHGRSPPSRELRLRGLVADLHQAVQGSQEACRSATRTRAVGLAGIEPATSSLSGIETPLPRGIDKPSTRTFTSTGVNCREHVLLPELLPRACSLRLARTSMVTREEISA